MVSRVYSVGIQASGQHDLHTGFPRAEWGKDVKGLPLRPPARWKPCLAPCWVPALGHCTGGCFDYGAEDHPGRLIRVSCF